MCACVCFYNKLKVKIAVLYTRYAFKEENLFVIYITTVGITLCNIFFSCCFSGTITCHIHYAQPYLEEDDGEEE